MFGALNTDFPIEKRKYEHFNVKEVEEVFQEIGTIWKPRHSYNLIFGKQIVTDIETLITACKIIKYIFNKVCKLIWKKKIILAEKKIVVKKCHKIVDVWNAW